MRQTFFDQFVTYTGEIIGTLVYTGNSRRQGIYLKSCLPSIYSASMRRGQYLVICSEDFSYYLSTSPPILAVLQ